MRTHTYLLKIQTSENVDDTLLLHSVARALDSRCLPLSLIHSLEIESRGVSAPPPPDSELCAACGGRGWLGVAGQLARAMGGDDWRPCSICQGSGRRVRSCPRCSDFGRVQGNSIGDYFVECQGCGAKSDQQSCETRRGAVERWNAGRVICPGENWPDDES